MQDPCTAMAAVGDRCTCCHSVGHPPPTQMNHRVLAAQICAHTRLLLAVTYRPGNVWNSS